VEPNSELFRDEIDLDEHGYILVDNLGRTSVANVFAVGDVANPVSPTISTAAGTAATAVKAIYSLICNNMQL
jgi:thioredoxin reductase (NADPH)